MGEAAAAVPLLTLPFITIIPPACIGSEPGSSTAVLCPVIESGMHDPCPIHNTAMHASSTLVAIPQIGALLSARLRRVGVVSAGGIGRRRHCHGQHRDGAATKDC